MADPGVPPTVEDASPEGGADKKSKKDIRTAETLLKVTYQNHIALSQLADTKANMLISINGLIVSVMIALLTPRLDSFSWQLMPGLVLIGGCVISLALAVVASRPRLYRRPVSLDQVRRNEGNVLFFGQFMTLSLEDFQESMRVIMRDGALLQDNLTRQLYYMGESLLQKYSRLQTAYSVFLATIALGAVAFVVVMAVLALPA